MKKISLLLPVMVILLTNLMIMNIFSITVNSKNNYREVIMKGPEGITYNPSDKAYYAVDAKEGIIYKIPADKKPAKFKTGLNTLMKPVIVDNKLYITSNDPKKLLCFNLESKKLDFELDFDFAHGIGGMAYEPSRNSLFIVDQQGGIYKVRLYDKYIDVISKTHKGNDIVYNPNTKLLYIATWGKKISTLNPDTNGITYLMNTVEENYTAISLYKGYFILSLWNNRLYAYDQEFSKKIFIDVAELDNPVGTCWNPDENELAVCNYSFSATGKIQFYIGIEEKFRDN